jgi:hypothetical protein
MSSNHLPENLLLKRCRLQLIAMESPTDLPGTRSLGDSVVSPMTDLAKNLGDTSLGLTPVQDSKRRLSMDSESSDSTPSPKEKLNFSIETPLTSLTNKPKRLLQQASRLSFGLLVGSDEQNKENIPCGGFSSPGKQGQGHSVNSPRNKHIQKVQSPAKKFSPTKSPGFGLRKLSPLKDNSPKKISPIKKRLAKRPVFTVLDEDVEDCSSRDSEYDSQNLEDFGTRKRKPNPGSMDDILQDCSPDKEDGITPLKSSPDRDEKIIRPDGFEFDSLATISEDQENESPKFDLNTLLSNKILPSQLEGKEAFINPLEEDVKPPELPFARKPPGFGNQNQSRPTFRRALSMLDRPTGADFDSPVSRNPTFNLSRFKRPEPPKDEETENSSKRRKFNPSSLMPERSFSLQGSDTKKPKFFRSHSENELSVMHSCQLKEEIEDILPDSSRLYVLPSLSSGNKHPSLRSISCETMANVIQGEYDHCVNSYRIIDARYAFEYQGGHIKDAENWQHGEDDAFISAFLPSQPLPAPPRHNINCESKRDILIFHCEFSSQRGPDFYMKLRERDRQLNQHVYPALHYPECYLLHLGYKEFYMKYPELCTGEYTAMVDPKHEQDLRKMRAKSKSWSGGTIARTSRMGRLHL